MKLQIPLSNIRYATLFNCYAPTLAINDEDRKDFYSRLDEETCAVANTDMIIMLGDFTARVGRDQ